MSTDSSFNDKRPETVPTTPEKDMDPVMDPNSPLRDPLARPTVVPTEHPQGWRRPQRAVTAFLMMTRCRCLMIDGGEGAPNIGALRYGS